MALVTATNPTLTDWKDALGPDNKISSVIELLMQENDILQDISFMEGNLPTGLQTTVRTGIPEPTWRRFNQGVQPTKSRRGKLTVACAQMAAYNEVDCDLADLGGNANAFRLSEARATIEGFNQQLARQLFFGKVKNNPEIFNGLAHYYAARSGVESADNVIHAGGAGADNRSIWLVLWGEESVTGVVPQGVPAGFRMEDKGKVTSENAGGTGTRMEVYRSYFEWKVGLAVRDWRYAVRICNIDKSELQAENATTPQLPDLMFEAMELIPSMGMGRPAFYMSRDVRTALRQQLSRRVAGSTLTTEQVGGVMQTSFHGVPLRRVDALAANEALVAA